MSDSSTAFANASGKSSPADLPRLLDDFRTRRLAGPLSLRHFARAHKIHTLQPCVTASKGTPASTSTRPPRTSSSHPKAASSWHASSSHFTCASSSRAAAACVCSVNSSAWPNLTASLAASFGSCQKRQDLLEQAVCDFAPGQRQDLACGMTAKDILAALDETFHPDCLLVALDPDSSTVSGLPPCLKTLAYNTSGCQWSPPRVLVMEHRYEVRLGELLEDAEVRPGLLRGLLPRLETFLQPFVRPLLTPQQRLNAQHYVQGCSPTWTARTPSPSPTCTTANARACRSSSVSTPGAHNPSSPSWLARSAPPWAVLTASWSWTPPPSPRRATPPSAWTASGVGGWARLTTARSASYLSYVSHTGHALVDCRLYLPKSWTQDRQRLDKAGVPKGVRFRTRHELALDMLDQHKAVLPHAWVAGDDEMGRCSWFRRELSERGERYLLAVPSTP